MVTERQEMGFKLQAQELVLDVQCLGFLHY